MIEVRDAYKILGVKEGASKDDIVKRYDLLLKKYKMSTLGITDNASEKINIDEVNKAYSILMGYETAGEEEESDKKRPNPVLSPILRKLKIDEKKADNFLHYHKYHIVISIIALIVLITTLRSCIMRVTPDVNISFIGEFYASEGDELIKNHLKSEVPELKEPAVEFIPLSENMDGQQAYAYQMKVVAQMTAGDVDVYILDRYNFDRFAGQGAFMGLDVLKDELDLDMDKNKDYVVDVKDVGKNLYGLDISDSKVLKDSGIIGDNAIVAIKFNAKNYENAINVLKLLLEK